MKRFVYMRSYLICDRLHKDAMTWKRFMHYWPYYDDVIMGAMASQITSLTIVYSAVYSGADQSKHQSSASLAFVWGIHRGPVNSPHKWPVTRKMFPFDDVIMFCEGNLRMVDFRYQGPIVRTYDALFDTRMNKLLNKQSGCRRFETQWRSYDIIVMWQAAANLYDIRQ